MLAGFGISTRQQLMELRQYNQTGEFEYKGKQQFFFHGRGCRLINSQIEIDWDFGIEDNWCGIDPWKLYYYIKKNNKPYSKFSNPEDIENELIKACDCGEMKKAVGLYYFAHMLNKHLSIKTITNTEGKTEWTENNKARRHGQYAEWHDNGRIRCLEEYSNGKINGRVQRWDRSGNNFLKVITQTGWQKGCL